MKTFANFCDAFDYCQELDRPVEVQIIGESGLWMLWPTGYARRVLPKPVAD